MKMKWLIFLLFVIADAQYVNISGVPEYTISTTPCSDQNHIFLAPGVLTAGSSNRACISRFYIDGPARMVVGLLTENEKAVTASRDLPAGDGGCIDISVPQLPNTKADLIVSLSYTEAKCTWQRRMTVRISAGKLVVVHTERARYRPGETMRARFFILKADMTPAHGTIDEIWLEGPQGAWEGTRAAQWHNVRTRLGIAQVQYDLDELAPAGKWTVRVRLGDGSQGSAAFWVGNYELPPFQLSVRHALKVLRSSERLVWTVCVRYPWAEAVEGMLVIRIRGAGGTTVSNTGTGGIRTVVRLRAPKACHRHAAAARRIGLAGTNPPDVVVADFSFQEEGTRIWQNTTVVSQVVEKPVTLEFLTKHRAVISPGLPYKLKIKATRWDDKAASNERIQVCHSLGLSEVINDVKSTCNDAVTDAKGIAVVMFTAGTDNAAFYTFKATLKNDTKTSAQPLLLPVRRGLNTHAALGPLRVVENVRRTFVPLYLNMNISNSLTVHFVVITRGGIIYRWGATTQCPVPSYSEQLHSAVRNTKCNSNLQLNRQENVSDNASDALVDRHLLRVMLPIKVSHQMCPDGHLLAYFYYKGEFVSASKHFEMEECFENKMEISWLSRQTHPGSTASLQISVAGPALCALTALDTAAKWMEPRASVKEVLMGRLRKLIEEHRNLTEYDAAGECFLTMDRPDEPTSSIELTTSWLAAAGVRTLGGDQQRRRCSSSPPATLVADDEQVPRSDFSESWLWRLVAVGSNKTVVTTAKAPDSITRYEASAACVARSGISISSPAVLQVFRDFFIHADGPKRLKHGDSTIIRYRIFNYLYQPLSVQIQILTDKHLKGPKPYVESACVASRSSIARRVELSAVIPGNARVSIRATSVSEGCNTTITRSVRDEIIIEIAIDPEGVPVQEYKSTMLCGKDSPESSSSQVFWSWEPVQTVPGTEALTVWTTADLAGPLIADGDSLTNLPRGCGEQNMARLATNLLALSQLNNRTAAAATAKEHVARGFTRQLQYVHPSGGFSAFGSSDTSPSTWLTAFSIRYLRRAHQVLSPGYPVPPAIERAEKWLISQQMENGCFRNEGQVFHRELKGGLNEEGEIASVALTAYVITSLVESSIPLPSRIIRNSLSCLRALPLKSTSSMVYAHTLLAYAFMRLKRYEEDLRKSNEAYLWDRKGLQQEEEIRELVELLKIARRDKDFVWWETGSLSTSIEATSYAVLSLSECPVGLRDSSCNHDSRGALRWLATHRSSTGGFISTQDTLVALEALIRWSSIQPALPTNLTVTARSTSVTKTADLRTEDKIPEVMKMGVSDQISVSVEGTGCALVQATRSYNTISSDPRQNKLLSVQLTVHTEGPFDCDANGTSCFCAAVVETCVVWSGSFPQMALLEVSLPSGYGADASLLYAQLQQYSTLLRRIEVTPNSGRVTLYLSTRHGSDVLGRGGHHCYLIHAVGPNAKTKPGHATLLDYYNPVVNDTQMFSISEECPPRISHNSNQYIASENLFNKAKSLSDDEIVITNEFSFEDIPEGIPLEDPLYDNLTELNEKESNEIPKALADKKQAIKPSEKQNVNKESITIPTDFDTTNSKHIEKVFDNEQDTNLTKNSNEMVSTTNNTKILIDSKLDFKNETPIAMREAYEINNNDTFVSTQEFVNVNTTYENTENKTLKNSTKEIEVNPISDSINEISNGKFETKHRIEIRDDSKELSSIKGVDNPKLSNFHIIESDKDLDVPIGIEGPIPAMILPPEGFVPTPPRTDAPPTDSSYSRLFGFPAQDPYYQRIFDDTYLRHFRKFNPPPVRYEYDYLG